jgi:2-polyprenyl-6-methoxyphenol hydroxylase-like FAD-dependent oxidoreductase
MRAVVVGGGPVGMFCGMALARRGDDVIVVDRDPGPPAGLPRRDDRARVPPLDV